VGMTSRCRLMFAALTISLSGCCHIFGSGESDESDADGFNDCDDKDEGDECSLCAPDDEDCVETMVVKTCNADGQCGSGDAVCAIPEGCASDHEHH
jgi:hypothetical protein